MNNSDNPEPRMRPWGAPPVRGFQLYLHAKDPESDILLFLFLDSGYLHKTHINRIHTED